MASRLTIVSQGESDGEADLYWKAVEEFDLNERLQIHDKLKDLGDKFWQEWVKFVEQRPATA